jgi:uncharacterized membrane protein
MNPLLPGLDAAPDIHPLFVHFPIAFWVAATGAWVLATIRRPAEQPWQFGLWLHTLAVISAAVAVAFGYAAADRMGHDSAGHDLVHTHRNFMLAASGLALALTLAAWRFHTRGRRWRIAFTVCSLGLVGLVALGADRGAALVYTHGVGVAVQTAPRDVGDDASTAVTPPSAESAHGHGAHAH